MNTAMALWSVGAVSDRDIALGGILFFGLFAAAFVVCGITILIEKLREKFKKKKDD